ncbi:MAG TPA: type IV pilus assembly protein PilM [Candidatus Hydrogenedentes bacterium]|nr:type IV pilus assembly protein PilM [Candidatus Hydrogenedentota bacterium]HPG68690.1 type IV pilus assembly protein PilM [Candidatus Hydrogenedentota bacterium]
MALLKRRRARRLILDVGSNTLRLCELKSTKAGYQVTKYVQREVLEDPSLNEHDLRRRRFRAIKEILGEAKARSRKTVLGVAGRSVFTRSRALPPVPEHKVTQIVRYEIQQQIPFSLDQIAIDYQVVDRTEAGGYEVMMVAIKEDVVEKEVHIVDDIKGIIDVVDVCPLAAYNWLKHTGAFGDRGECVALIDVGASTTDIVIEREGLFRSMRSLNLGGNDVTAALSREFGMNFADAERLKRTRGFAPTGDPNRDGKGGEVIGQVLSQLVTEVNRSFSYFRSLPGGGAVSRVILTGGGAMLANLGPFLQRELGVPVVLANPLAGLTIAGGAEGIQANPQQATTVLGLALRCCQAVPIEINLIPRRALEAARLKEQAFYWVLVLVTLALIMASIIPMRANENKIIRERTSLLEQFVQAYDPELVQNPTGQSQYQRQLQGAKSAVGRRQNQVAMLDTAIRKRRFWLPELERVNEARPTGNKIWISSMESTVFGRQGQNLVSSGFPGLNWGGGGAAAGGRNLLMDPEVRSTAPPEPNGLKILGYARTPEALAEFVANLRQPASFGPTCVGFDERLAEMVPISELDNARIVPRAELGGMAPRGGGPGPAMGAPQPGSESETVVYFMLNLVFPVENPEQPE